MKSYITTSREIAILNARISLGDIFTYIDNRSIFDLQIHCNQEFVAYPPRSHYSYYCNLLLPQRVRSHSHPLLKNLMTVLYPRSIWIGGIPSFLSFTCALCDIPLKKMLMQMRRINISNVPWHSISICPATAEGIPCQYGWILCPKIAMWLRRIAPHVRRWWWLQQ